MGKRRRGGGCGWCGIDEERPSAVALTRVDAARQAASAEHIRGDGVSGATVGVRAGRVAQHGKNDVVQLVGRATLVRGSTPWEEGTGGG